MRDASDVIVIPFVVAAWLTHVVTTLSHGAVFACLIGAVIAPLGVLHGVLIWLGLSAI